jgi:hypothetical protein
MIHKGHIDALRFSCICETTPPSPLFIGIPIRFNHILPSVIIPLILSKPDPNDTTQTNKKHDTTDPK